MFKDIAKSNISKNAFNEHIEIFMKKMKLSKDYATMQRIISR